MLRSTRACVTSIERRVESRSGRLVHACRINRSCGLPRPRPGEVSIWLAVFPPVAPKDWGKSFTSHRWLSGLDHKGQLTGLAWSYRAAGRVRPRTRRCSLQVHRFVLGLPYAPRVMPSSSPSGIGDASHRYLLHVLDLLVQDGCPAWASARWASRSLKSEADPSSRESTGASRRPG